MRINYVQPIIVMLLKRTLQKNLRLDILYFFLKLLYLFSTCVLAQQNVNNHDPLLKS